MSNYRIVGAVLIIVSILVIGIARLLNPFHIISGVGEKIKGDPNSPIEIVEFSDFQCGMCKDAQPLLEKLLDEFDGEVKLKFQHFPLNSHRHSILVHTCAECADRQGKFWDFHDLLFDNQAKWSVQPQPLKNLMKYARELNFNMAKFEKCLTDSTVLKLIKAQKVKGKELGINQTPTFIVNKKVFIGIEQFENMRSYIMSLSKKQRSE